jgi:hypothetical protein
MALDCTDDGTRIIVGAYLADVGGTDRGQAFVFEWNGSGWVRVGNILQGTQDGEVLGYAVAISGDGNYIAVGSPVYDNNALSSAGRYGVFYLNGSTWTIVPDSGSLTGTSSPIVDYFVGTASNERVGHSLSLSYDGKTIVAGHRGNVSGAGSDAGQLRVHTYVNGEWTQKGQALSGLESGDRLGESVKITSDGNHLIAGAIYGSVSAVYVYDYNSSSSEWDKRTTLTHPTLPSTNTHNFGTGIAISDDGNTVAVGANADDGSGTDWGKVYVFTWSGLAWTLVSTLVSPLQGTNGELFGSAVDLSGDGTRLVAAAAYENNQQGYAFTYEYNGGSWQLRNYSTSGSAGAGTSGRLGEYYTGLIISRDGSTIVGGDEAGSVGKVRVWNMPSNIKSIWGSNDDVNWTKITTGNETFRVDDRLEFKNLDNPNYYKYHAIVADAFTRLKDVKLFGVRKQGTSTLHDGALTLTKNLDVPRIGPPPDADDTPRRDRLVVEYNTSTNPVEDGLVKDTSGRGNDGAFYGGASYNATEKAFNTPNLTGIIRKNINLPGGNIPLSVSAWFRLINTTTTTNDTIICLGTNSTATGGGSFILRVNTDQLRINFEQSSNYTEFTKAISNGRWYHVVATYDGGTSASARKLFIDGVEIAQTSTTGTITGVNLPVNPDFTVGMRTDISGYINGFISNFKLYDTTLTAQEVKTLYDMGRCDEGHHVVNFSKTRVGIGLGDGEVPRGDLDVRGDTIFRSRVGIGVTNPATYLHLFAENSDPGVTEGDFVGTHNLTEYLRFTSRGDSGDVNSVSVGFKLGADDNSAASPDGRLDICANDGGDSGNSYGTIPDKTIATFIGSGNVGIGTTNPYFQTDIAYSGTADINYGLNIHNTYNSGTSNRMNTILFSDANSTQGAIGGYRVSYQSHYLGGLVFYTGSQPNGYNQGKPTGASDATQSLTEAMRIKENGNVGIGTDNPTATLEVIGSGRDHGIYSTRFYVRAVGDNSGDGTPFDDDTGSPWYGLGYDNLAWNNQSYKYSGDIPILSGYSGVALRSGSGNLILTTGGLVGIGTTNPYAKLHVSGASGSISSAARVFFKYNSYVAGASGSAYLIENSNQNWNDMGIYANDDIVSGAYIVSHGGSISASDSRIKKEIVDVEDGSALENLRLLKPKQYKYKDEVQRGSEPVWGFIAQEVRDTLPFATQLRTECLPNIYEMANVSVSNVITFTNFNTSNLESNAMVLKVFDKDDTEHLINITEVVDDHSVRVEEDLSEWTGSVDESGNVVAGNQLFVYGQRVDDFVFLRKESIWTVATSALQEVDRQLQAEKAKVTTLETQVADLLARVQTLESA